MKHYWVYIIPFLIALPGAINVSKASPEIEKCEAPTIEEEIEDSEFVEAVAEVSAYTSDPAETDDTPFITASGERVRHGIIACPRDMEFGTEVEIRGVIYECADRMNERYEYNNIDNYDIWFKDKHQAIQWGRRHVTVRVYQ